MISKKKYLFMLTLCLGTLSSAMTLQEAVTLVDKAPLMQASSAKTKAYKKLYKAEQSLQYPTLDLSYSGTYLKEKPLLYLNGSLPGLPPETALQVQSQNQYKGAIKLTYPLFSGFAITAMIDKAKLTAQKAALEEKNTKRNLYLNTVKLYTAALTLHKLEESQNIAYHATEKSYEKAQAYFDLGMIAKSELYRLEAALAAIKAQRIATRNEYKTILTQLSALLHTEVKSVTQLPQTTPLSLEILLQKALVKRPDLLALKKIVAKEEQQIKVAKSSYYPNIALFAQVAQVGDSTALNGDGYTNKDRSAAGFVINYNIFSGFRSSNELQAAEASKLSALAMLTSYKDTIKSELTQSYLNYKSLQQQKEAKTAQLKAQLAYEALVKGEFSNHLTDADTLSRAIAASALARASLIAIEAKLYTAYAQLLLEVDNETFLNRFKGAKND